MAELNSTLHEAQAGLPANVVVVVTRESDMYAEVLYLLSFAGLIFGSVAALIFRFSMHTAGDLISLPLMGFAAGSTLYHFRRFFLGKIAPRAVREKVVLRAKATFLDQSQAVKGKLVLFFFSEIEREAVLLASPEFDMIVTSRELKKLLHKLSTDYNSREPLKALAPALIELGAVLKTFLGTNTTAEEYLRRITALVGASDREITPVIPVIKGSKDIN